ncbi:MAG: molybdopterin cofactor-binding domain-containing protein [Pseudomonadota bacterium]
MAACSCKRARRISVPDLHNHAQIAADALGLPVERVRFELGDTTLPETPVSGGLTNGGQHGLAVKLAALALRDKLVNAAVADIKSPLHGLQPAGVSSLAGELSAGDGVKKDSFTALVERSGQPEITAQVSTQEAEERKKFSLHSFGAQFVEVRVDEDTGEVRVARALGASLPEKS